MEKYIVGEETYKALNNLLSKNRDAGKGFVEVANNINYVELTQWLINQAKTHEEHGDQLEHVIKELGGEPDSDTSVLGELHHVWIDLKAQWTNNDTAALLDECIRGQESALNDYQETISIEVLPGFARDILNRQKSKIEEAVKDLKFLKMSYGKKEDANA